MLKDTPPLSPPPPPKKKKKRETSWLGKNKKFMWFLNTIPNIILLFSPNHKHYFHLMIVQHYFTQQQMANPSIKFEKVSWNKPHRFMSLAHEYIYTSNEIINFHPHERCQAIWKSFLKKKLSKTNIKPQSSILSNNQMNHLPFTP